MTSLRSFKTQSAPHSRRMPGWSGVLLTFHRQVSRPADGQLQHLWLKRYCGIA